MRLAVTTLADPVEGSLNSSIARAEAFIDSVGANGSGIPMRASDGFFNDTTEGAYADIPLTTVKQLSNGNHTLYVRAKVDQELVEDRQLRLVGLHPIAPGHVVLAEQHQEGLDLSARWPADRLFPQRTSSR